MIYLIPKCINQKKEYIERCFQYLDSIDKLKIDYNPKKSIYPRLVNTKKRGMNAVTEIINSIEPSYFSDKYRIVSELIIILKWGLRKTEYNGIQVLTIKKITSEIFTDKYFPLSEWSHISETDVDLLNTKINIMSNTLFNKEDEEPKIDSVNILKTHLDNYVLSEKDKLELIKYIITN